MTNGKTEDQVVGELLGHIRHQEAREKDRAKVYAEWFRCANQLHYCAQWLLRDYYRTDRFFDANDQFGSSVIINGPNSLNQFNVCESISLLLAYSVENSIKGGWVLQHPHSDPLEEFRRGPWNRHNLDQMAGTLGISGLTKVDLAHLKILSYISVSAGRYPASFRDEDYFGGFYLQTWLRLAEQIYMTLNPLPDLEVWDMNELTAR